MRINKGICISVSNITFAFIMILKNEEKEGKKYVGWKIGIKNKNMKKRIRKMRRFRKRNDEELKMVRNKKENEESKRK